MTASTILARGQKPLEYSHSVAKSIKECVTLYLISALTLGSCPKGSSQKKGLINATQEYRQDHAIIEPRFFFGLCPVSLLFDNPSNNVTLKACSGCNSVCYSDREAQKADWKKHKSICKALQPLGEFPFPVNIGKMGKTCEIKRGSKRRIGIYRKLINNREPERRCLFTVARPGV